MLTDFSYLLDKIADTEFQSQPFKHLEIRDFLSKEHFDAITNSPSIRLGSFKSTEELLDAMESQGYKVIPFPGCVTSKKKYLDWFNKKSHTKVHEATEGFGIVLRLSSFDNSVLQDLNTFFESKELVQVLTEKFKLSGQMTVDAGVQKYLHGYEISPHPDIRRKALTWMLNINPGQNTEDHNFHTHYLQLKPAYRYVGEFWKGNPEFDREWLPWDWCDTIKKQPNNNSIVFFSPSNDTLHAVKAYYDHLSTQRTQFYGNLWHPVTAMKKVEFRALDVITNQQRVEETRPLMQRMRMTMRHNGVGAAYRGVKSKLFEKEQANIRKV